ncbi:MAG: NUDIX hydrolase [Thermomicrobiales bacterium]
MRTRLAVRTLVVNERDEILLIQHQNAVAVDPTQPDLLTYWVAPGGGIERDETFEEAAIRELWEETGISGVNIGPWIWSRERQIVIHGEAVQARERHYLARVGDPAVSFANIEEGEFPVFKDYRWWALAALRETADFVIPSGFPELVTPVLAGQLPAPPLTLRL